MIDKYTKECTSVILNEMEIKILQGSLHNYLQY